MAEQQSEVGTVENLEEMQDINDRQEELDYEVGRYGLNFNEDSLGDLNYTHPSKYAAGTNSEGEFLHDEGIASSELIGSRREMEVKKVHKHLLDGFFEEHKADAKQHFQEFQQQPAMDSKSPGEGKVLAKDVALLMRVILYYGNITLHAETSDNEELFSKPSSQTMVMESLQQFFGEDSIDPNTKRVSYKEFVDFVYSFVLNSDGKVCLKKENDDGVTKVYHNQGDVLESLLEKELTANLKKYETLSTRQDISKPERAIAETMIVQLKKQLQALKIAERKINPLIQGGSSPRSPASILSRSQLREKALKESFVFYARQQILTGPQLSFDYINNEKNSVSLACFLLMLKQVGVLNTNKHVSKKEVQIMFKRYSSSYKELDFSTFKDLLDKVAVAYYRDETSADDVKVDKFFKLIKIDEPQVFQSSRKLLSLPFKIKDIDGFRQLPQDRGREIILRKISPEVREQIIQHKEEKKKNAINIFTSMELKRSSLSYNSSPSLIIKDNSFIPPGNNSPQNYTDKKTKLQRLATIPDFQKARVSWNQLERLSFSDMKNMNKGIMFKPTDFFNDNDDDEDQVYLAEYNLEEDKRRKVKESLINKKEQENYGQLKDILRPTQRYMMLKESMSTLPSPRGNQQQQYGSEAKHVDYLSPSHGGKRSSAAASMNAKMSERVQQISKDQRAKEQLLMQSIISKNQSNIQRGIHAAGTNRQHYSYK